MAEVSLPISKPDELPRPIGVMPNWAYGKTQFNDLDIYKQIEPMLKADPVAMLGWQSYTTGNLEVRKAESSSDFIYPGRFFSFGGKKNLKDRANLRLEEMENLGATIPRRFKSADSVDKLYYTDLPEGKFKGSEEETLLHELRHAGLQFLTKRTGEDMTIQDYSIQAFADTHDLDDEEGVFEILDRAMLKNFFPDAEQGTSTIRRKALKIYDERKSARKEIDKRVAKLNALATQELKAIRNTSVSERLKQKSLKGEDKSTIKNIIEWIFSQKQPNNLDTQMKALKVR